MHRRFEREDRRDVIFNDFCISKVCLGGSVATWCRLWAVLGPLGGMLKASCSQLEEHGAKNEAESIRVRSSEREINKNH